MSVIIKGFKSAFVTEQRIKAFLDLVVCDGTIGMAIDTSKLLELETLADSDLLDMYDLEDSETCDLAYKEYILLLHMLKMAIAVGAQSIYACYNCHYVSSQSPCSCDECKFVGNIQL